MGFIYFPESSEATCGLKCPQSHHEHFWDTLFHKLSPETEILIGRWWSTRQKPRAAHPECIFLGSCGKWSSRRMCWFTCFPAWICLSWMHSFPFPKPRKDLQKNFKPHPKQTNVVWMYSGQSQELARCTSTSQTHSISPSKWLQCEGNSCVRSPISSVEWREGLRT